MVISNLKKYRIILAFLLATGFLFFTSGVAMGAIWYVDGQAEPDPTDCNRGDTWAKAFKIINKAHECASAGDEIWVKEGVYDDNWPEINVTKEVSIYGSFAGDEVHRDDRDLKTHRTIIKDVYAPFQIRADTIIDGFEVTGCSAPFMIGYPWDSSGAYAPSVVISNIIAYRCTQGAEIVAGSITFTNYTISDMGEQAFYIRNSSVTFTNCTFWNNGDLGDDSYISGDSSATFRNCIYWGDTLAFGNLHPDSSKLTATYSNIEGGYPGEGNIDADPLFVSDSDFHLTASSPCIDTGTSEGAPNHDFEGDVRPQGSGYDIGADEFMPQYIEVVLDIKPGSYPNSINLKSRGKLPVAILSTGDFDAYDVDPVSCEFAGAYPVRWKMKDVDNDGDHDMLLHCMTQELELTKESTEATLEGTTIYGVQITGTDSVNIVPKDKGYGKEGKKKKKK